MKLSSLKLRPLLSEDETSFRNAISAFKSQMPPFEFAFDFDGSIPSIKNIKKLEGWAIGKGLPHSIDA